MKLTIINGVNLNMLGQREPSVYGTKTLADIENDIRDYCAKKGVDCEFFQSNIEGEICEIIQKCTSDGIVINAGAYTHYSIAIRDAIKGRGLPAVEVHISNIFAREEFRQKSIIADVCRGTVIGFGEKGYLLAIDSFLL